MTFNYLVADIVEGSSASRKSWPITEYVYMNEDIGMVKVNGSSEEKWEPSAEDLNSRDWYIIE